MAKSVPDPATRGWERPGVAKHTNLVELCQLLVYTIQNGENAVYNLGRALPPRPLRFVGGILSTLVCSLTVVCNRQAQDDTGPRGSPFVAIPRFFVGLKE